MTPSLLKRKIKEILARRERRIINGENLIRAAVLIPIYEKAGEIYILFTKRTEEVEHHKGQISFPGGARSKEDKSLLDTALRESFEEIGLRPEVVEVLGELDDERTFSTNFIISPFVAFVPYPYQFKPNPEEVKELIEVPLSALLNQANFREELLTEGDNTFLSYVYLYQNQVIWGATARILKKLLDLLSD